MVHGQEPGTVNYIRGEVVTYVRGAFNNAQELIFDWYRTEIQGKTYLILTKKGPKREPKRDGREKAFCQNPGFAINPPFYGIMISFCFVIKKKPLDVIIDWILMNFERWDLMVSLYACWCIGHSESGSDPRIPTSWTKCCFLSAPKGFNLRSEMLKEMSSNVSCWCPDAFCGLDFRSDPSNSWSLTGFNW